MRAQIAFIITKWFLCSLISFTQRPDYKAEKIRENLAFLSWTPTKPIKATIYMKWNNIFFSFPLTAEEVTYNVSDT